MKMSTLPTYNKDLLYHFNTEECPPTLSYLTIYIYELKIHVIIPMHECVRIKLAPLSQLNATHIFRHFTSY